MRQPRAIGLAVLILLPGFVGATRPATAAPDDPAASAVDTLLRRVDREPMAGEAAGVAAWLEGAAIDPWLLVEHLLARGRAELGIRAAKAVDASKLGPVLDYAESPGAADGVASRAKLLAAARAAQATGDTAAALRALDALRTVPGRHGVFAVEGEGLRADLLAADRPAEALEARLVAGEAALRCGWWARAEALLDAARDAANLARVFPSLQRAYQGVRAVREARRDPDAAWFAGTEHDLGSIAQVLGDFPAALRHFGEAASMYDALGDAPNAAAARSQVSDVLAETGDLRRALDMQRALELWFTSRPRDGGFADHRIHVGSVRLRVGDAPGAFAAFEEARAAYAAAGDAEGETIARGNLGLAHALAGRFEAAVAAYRAVLVTYEEANDPRILATAKNNLAEALAAAATAEREDARAEPDAAVADEARARASARVEEAARLAGEAIGLADAAPSEWLACVARETRGDVLLAQDRPDEALAEFERAREDAIRLRAASTELAATVGIVRAHAARGDRVSVIREARRAVERIAESYGSLPGEVQARARAALPDVFELGVLAAVESRRDDDLQHFLEAGRAQALVRGLGGRLAALRATVPPELTARLDAATRAKVAAFAAWSAADATVLSVKRARWSDYERRRTEEQQALELVLDAQTSSSGRLLPARLASIAEVRAQLRATSRPGLRQVFATFDVRHSRAIALLVEESGTRVVRLPADGLEELRAALASLAASRDGVLDPSALATVRRRLVEPLGIPPGPVRLFVCPDEELAYAPLAAVVPDDWEVVFEPSATTWALLAERRLRRGRGVFGLGDPDYRTVPDADALTTRGGPRLVPLPATRAEVEGITGRPEDRRLLGRDATERGLAKALSDAGGDRTWRAIHLACHGLVDVERPELSCLALAVGEGEDGFLTTNEVLRLPLRTDLAVLSACRTGRGVYVRGEGILGLSRAFMYAGATRVLVSLWDVDDRATALLMEAFYREWTAGRGTTEALRLAQRAVRDHEVSETVPSPGAASTKRTTKPYADPKYWAAWMLWGPPD